MPLQNSQILRDVSYPFSRVERVTVVPQVFLQNDQEQPDSDDDRAVEERRKNRKNEKKPKKDRKRNNKGNKEMNNKNSNKLQNMIPPTSTAEPSKKSIRREQRRRNFNGQQTPIRYEKSLNGSQVLIAGSRPTTTQNTPYIINLNDKQIGLEKNENVRKLSRTIRSKSQAGGRRRNQNKMQRDIIMPIESVYVGSSRNHTSEKIDLNPKHCYDVSGMSKGQQKICEQYTSIMPAISRGARAAIQVKHFFYDKKDGESDINILFVKVKHSDGRNFDAHIWVLADYEFKSKQLRRRIKLRSRRLLRNLRSACHNFDFAFQLKAWKSPFRQLLFISQLFFRRRVPKLNIAVALRQYFREITFDWKLFPSLPTSNLLSHSTVKTFILIRLLQSEILLLVTEANVKLSTSSK